MLKAEFVFEKETKNTVRYAEEETDSPPIIGTLYVKKWALKKLNGGSFPQRIAVTVEVPVSRLRKSPE